MALPTTFVIDEFKPVKLSKVDVVFADKPGRNRNVYSKAVLKEAIDYYKRLTELDPTYKYAFAKHPKDVEEEWIGLIAGAIDDIYFDDAENLVRADFTLLPTIWGQFIAWLLKNEYHIGISLRGTADAEQSSMVVAGKTIPIKQRHNLRLEGVDFVVYPSYIVTHASKENVTEQANTLDDTETTLLSLCSDHTLTHSDVLESFIQDTSDAYDIDAQDIKQLLTKTVKENTVRRNTNMSGTDLDTREAKIAVDELNVAKAKLQREIEALTSEVESFGQDAESKRTELEELDAKIAERQDIVTGLNKIQDRLTAKQEELTSVEEKLQLTNVDLEALNDDYTNFKTKAEKQTVVRIAGKTFSSDTPPRLRVLPVTEKVTAADWNTVNKTNISQLVALTNDDTVAEQVFGVTGDVTNWEHLHVPVYQAFKSDEEDKDVDLVLNRHGLDEASAYLTGRNGLSMPVAEKAQLASFLHSKYTELETAGISEMPEQLRAIEQRATLLSSIDYDEPDSLVESVIEAAVLKGLVDFEIAEEDVTEQTTDSEDGDKVVEQAEDVKKAGLTVNREIALDNLTSAIMNTLMGINKGKVAERAVNIDADDQQAMVNDFVNTLVTAPDGSPTDFSEAFTIETVEDFTTKFLTPLSDLIANDDIVSALGMIEMAVATYAQAMVDATDNMDVAEHINTAFKVISSAMSPAENERDITTTDTDIDAQQDTVTEKTDKDTENKNDDGGTDEMLRDELQKKLEGRFEDVEITSDEDVITVVDKLITDYEQSFAELNALTLKVAKREKTTEMKEHGIDDSVIASELEGVESVEELDTLAAKLINVAKSVTESAKDKDTDSVVIDAEATQKSTTVVEQVEEKTTDDNMSNFQKIMGSV